MSQPVRIELNAECHQCGSDLDTYEIERERWDTMTPAQRVEEIEEAAKVHAFNKFGWGFYIHDATDRAGTE